MARFRTSLLMSIPLVGFIGAPMMYAGMLGYAVREGRRPFLAFLAVAAFCLAHYGAMVLGFAWGLNRFGGFGAGTVLAGCVAGLAVALVFLNAIHPKPGWLEG